MNIELPRVEWALGDPEPQATTITVRPLYHQRKGSVKFERVGSVLPEFAGLVLEALTHGK